MLIIFVPGENQPKNSTQVPKEEGPAHAVIKRHLCVPMGRLDVLYPKQPWGNADEPIDPLRLT